MNAIKTILMEDLKDLFKTKKIIFILAMILFIMVTVYASGFLQVIYLLFFKPIKTIAFPISITYYLLFITIPAFALLLGHDSISSEIENSHIRGIISKTKRSSFIISKFLSIFTVISLLSFLLLAASSIYTYIKIEQLDIINPLFLFLYLLLYIAAITSITIFFSSLFQKSSTSLFTIIVFHLGLIYINTGQTAVIPIFSYMNNIISLENIPIALITFAIYTIIFITASLLIFGAKDL